MDTKKIEIIESLPALMDGIDLTGDGRTDVELMEEFCQSLRRQLARFFPDAEIDVDWDNEMHNPIISCDHYDEHDIHEARQIAGELLW